MSNFFLKNLTLSVTRYYSQLSSCKISEKTNDPILRKLSDGETDRQAGRQTQMEGQTAGRRDRQADGQRYGQMDRWMGVIS